MLFRFVLKDIYTMSRKALHLIGNIVKFLKKEILKKIEKER
jgi:hypothetical protein